MEPSCRIYYHYVALSCLCGFKSVVHYGSRIGALGVLYYVNACSLCPHLKLVDSCRTECVRCRYEDLLALLFELVAELAYGCGLACAVYADDHYYCGGYGKVQTCVVAHYLRDNFMDKSHYLLGVGDAALLYLLAEPVAYLLGGLNSDIAHYHLLLELVEKLLVDNGKRVEYSLDTAEKEILGLSQTAGNFRKKSHYILQTWSINHIAATLSSVTKIIEYLLRPPENPPAPSSEAWIFRPPAW